MAWMARQALKLRLLNTCQLQPLTVLQTLSAQKRTSLATACIACHRNSSTLHPAKQNLTRNSDTEFRNIYVFRYIVHTRVLSRLKIYQTLLTVGAIPPALYLHELGIFSNSDLLGFFGITSLATAMLYVMSTFFRHIVGIISVNSSEDIVRISHLTFWGKRRDDEFEVSEIVPLSDMSVKPNDIFHVIQFYEEQTKFYWFHRHCRSVDVEAVQRVLGKI